MELASPDSAPGLWWVWLRALPESAVVVKARLYQEALEDAVVPIRDQMARIAPGWLGGVGGVMDLEARRVE